MTSRRDSSIETGTSVARRVPEAYGRSTARSPLVAANSLAAQQTLLVAGIVAAACTDFSPIRAADREYMVPHAEAALAARLEQNEPRVAGDACSYWKAKASKMDEKLYLFTGEFREWMQLHVSMSCDAAENAKRATESKQARQNREAREPSFGCQCEGPDGKCMAPEECADTMAKIQASRAKKRAQYWGDGDPKKTLEKELETGRCTERHIAWFQSMLGRINVAFTNTSYGSHTSSWLDVVDHPIFVAPTNDGKPVVLTIRNGIAQQIHLFVFQFGPDLDVEVYANGGNQITDHSQYEPSLEPNLSERGYETRRAFVAPHEEIGVVVGGHGCSMVVAMAEGHL